MDELIETLVERYQVGTAYATAYVEYWNRTGKSVLVQPSDLERLQAPESMWFDFALSANWRGRELARALGLPAAEESCRYLDIGCGFGGMLVAFSELGYEVNGMDLDPIRIALASENIKDLPERLRGQVAYASILDEGFVRGLGKFDLITCIDVIEHVSDVDAVLAIAMELLNDGGTLHLEIPNKDAISFVRSDGHFALMGITQLPRWAAIEYQQANFAFAYDVGDYYPIGHYTRILGRLGAVVEHGPSPLQPAVSWESAREDAHALLGQGMDGLMRAATLPDSVKPYLAGALDGYWSCLGADLRRAEADSEVREAFVERYGAAFWLVSATKPKVGRSS